MSGGSRCHAEIEVNLLSSLGDRLFTQGCRVYPANLRIKVPSAPPYRYADASVACGTIEFEKIAGVDTLVNPVLLIEVLSPSTEAYDRGDKFAHYQSIASLREYWLVAQHRAHVTQLVRGEGGAWLHRDFTSIDDILTPAAFELSLPLREIYRGVSFADAAQPIVIAPSSQPS
jgi:Uma2 family endonuclease